VVGYAFDDLTQNRLAAVNDVPNLSSERMLRRVGFVLHNEVQGPKYSMRTYLLKASDWRQHSRA
jgi:RimJ/RimL family protein N-acetyltransferase